MLPLLLAGFGVPRFNAAHTYKQERESDKCQDLLWFEKKNFYGLLDFINQAPVTQPVFLTTWFTWRAD